MHEYRLANNKPNSKPPGCDVANRKGSLRLDDWVLCRIYKKNNLQRPVDRDDIHDMISSIRPTLSIPNGQHNEAVSGYCTFLETDHILYEGMMSNAPLNPLGGAKATLTQLPLTAAASDANNHLPNKRALPNVYWTEEADPNSLPMKRFLGENCDGSMGTTTDEEATNSIANILSQLPHGPSLQKQTMIGSLEDGVLRQQQPPPYQVSSINWYS